MQIDGANAEMHWPSNAPRNNTHTLPKSIPSVQLTIKMTLMTLLSVATGRFLIQIHDRNTILLNAGLGY